MLVATDLHKVYGSTPVVCGVDLILQPGQVLGLLGPNGAGKSTTVGMLYGMVIPSQGSVTFNGIDVHKQGATARRCMGVVTQDDNLDPDLNVIDNLICFARHYHIIGREARHRADEVLEQVGLLGRETYTVSALSGGMMRRLVLARALLNDPQMVFLDEPTTGLDPDARQEFWRSVTQLKQAGRGVLLTTHYMDEAERLCDRLLLMQEGQIVDRGTPSELIARTVGQEVIEVEGVDPQLIEQWAHQLGTWWRPFSTGYLLILPPGETLGIHEQIAQHHPTRLLQRQANLEDVFLRLTGVRL